MIVDYSWGRPDPAGLAARGYVAAMRYLGSSSRDLSAAELRRLHDAGLAVGLIWETVARRPLDGYDAGRSDARRANEHADSLGAPGWLPIFYAVDFGATALQIAGPVADYFDGVRSVPGRPVGCYGSYPTVEHLMGEGLAVCAWQCAGWSGSGAGSGGSMRCLDGSVRRRSRHACMFQDVPERPVPGEDLNHVLLEPVEWVWHPDRVPVSSSQSLEDLMAKSFHVTTDGDAQWRVVTDGNGRLRREFLDGDTRALLLFAGELDGTVSLTRGVVDGLGIDHDRLIDALYALPETAPVHLSEQLTGVGLSLAAYVRDNVLPALAELTGRPIPGDIDEAVLAAELAGPLADAFVVRVEAEGLEVGIDEAQVADLVARLRVSVVPTSS